MIKSDQNLFRRLVLIAGLFVSATFLLPAYAQADWPTKPVRLIVPFAAGGATDQVARLVAAKISPILGTNVIVENKPGANGNIGVDLIFGGSGDDIIYAGSDDY